MPPHKQPQRINVVGTSGAGKSTFSQELARRLEISYIQMDQLHWLPNWTESPDDQFKAKLQQALAQESWVLDGNYSRTIPIKWQNVQMVVWLDYSFARTLYQAVKRATHRAWTKKELWPGTGNRESFRKSFLTKQSIIWWTITTFTNNRKSYRRLISDPNYAHIQFVRLGNRQEAIKFLAQWSAPQ